MVILETGVSINQCIGCKENIRQFESLSERDDLLYLRYAFGTKMAVCGVVEWLANVKPVSRTLR